MRLGWIRDGAVILVVGLGFAALGAESMGVFDACLATASCATHAGSLNVGEFLGLLILGIAMSVGGVMAVILGFRLAPKATATPDSPQG
jgi:uncharacterized membrane protein YidH (DUF202 family)